MTEILETSTPARSKNSEKIIQSIEERFLENQARIKSLIKDNRGHHNLVIAAFDGVIIEDEFKENIESIVKDKGDADFQIINLIRFLYLCDSDNKVIKDAKDQIVTSLAGFPFWPEPGTTGKVKENRNMDNMV